MLFRSVPSHDKVFGFEAKGRHFTHQNTELSVEFPTGPIGIGDRVPIKPEGMIKYKDTEIILLSPTQSVMDRLAWFYFNNDRQCFDQAIMICQHHNVNIPYIKEWSIEEKNEFKFNQFLKQILK